MLSDQTRPPTSAWITTTLRPMILFIGAVVLFLIAQRVFEQYLSIPLTIILLAIMLTYLLRPLVDGMVRFSAHRHLHVWRPLAVLALYAAIIWGCYAIGATTAKTLRADTATLQQAWTQAVTEMPNRLRNLSDTYTRTVPAALRVQIDSGLKKELDAVIPRLLPRVMGVAQVAVEWLGLLIELIFVPLVAFYLLTDPHKVRDQALSFVPERHRPSVLHYGGGMDRILRQYVIGQLILAIIAWVAVTAGMLALGVPGALMLGLIAGLSRAIPVLGPIIGGVPVLTMVWFSHQGHPAVFWWVLVGFVLLHLFESKILMPRILGDQLGIHPVIVIISLLVGYELLGLLGMFIAPPAIAMIRFFIAEHSARHADAPPVEDAVPAADSA